MMTGGPDQISASPNGGVTGGDEDRFKTQNFVKEAEGEEGGGCELEGRWWCSRAKRGAQVEGGKRGQLLFMERNNEERRSDHDENDFKLSK